MLYLKHIKLSAHSHEVLDWSGAPEPPTVYSGKYPSCFLSPPSFQYRLLLRCTRRLSFYFLKIYSLLPQPCRDALLVSRPPRVYYTLFPATPTQDQCSTFMLRCLDAWRTSDLLGTLFSVLPPAKIGKLFKLTSTTRLRFSYTRR